MSDSPTLTSKSGGSTSVGLLERVRASDQDAWRMLVRLYSPLVFYWCRQSSLQSSDAADVLQEVFRSVAAHVATFDRGGSGAFRAWLYTITKNKLRDHFRRRLGQPLAEGGTDAYAEMQQFEDSKELDPESSQRAENIVVHRTLAIVQNEFEQHTWRAFQRTAIDGASPADVAGELGMSTAAVYKAKSRVLARLRQELEGLGEGL